MQLEQNTPRREPASPTHNDGNPLDTATGPKRPELFPDKGSGLTTERGTSKFSKLSRERRFEEEDDLEDLSDISGLALSVGWGAVSLFSAYAAISTFAHNLSGALVYSAVALGCGGMSYLRYKYGS